MSEPEGNKHEEGGFLGRAEGPLDKGLEVGKRVAQGSDVVAGVGTGIKGAEVMSHIAPFGGTVMDAFTNGSEAVGAGESVLGTAGRALGPIGVGLSAAGTLGHGAALANIVSQEGPAAAYHDQKAYNEAGEMGLSAAHTALPFMGPYGEAANLALTGGELAADGVGAAAGASFGAGAKFNAGSVAGGLIRGTFGDQSLGEQARQGVSSVFGTGTAANIAGAAADGLVNVATLPGQLGATVGRGIVNEGKAIGEGIANGEGVVGGALNTAGRWAGNEASTIGSGVAAGARTLGTGIANGVSAAGTGLSNTASAVGSGLSTGASWLGGLASSVGNGIVSAGSAVGNGIANGTHKVVNGVKQAVQFTGEVNKALDVPLGQTYDATTNFIRDQPFFHQGLMNKPIGGEKHFRNVPFVGPARMIGSALTGNGTGIEKGWEVTRATWAAP